jgi:hypothetical protein
VANQKATPFLRLLKQVLFRVAFGGFIIVQLVVLWFLLWVASEIVPDPNYFLQGALLVLFFAGPFLIGAFSYLVFQRLTRVEYVLSESERWLAERHGVDPRRIKWRTRLRRWAVWIPAVSVLLAALYLDQTWAIASHLFHPGSGRLIGYRVSIPLGWTVDFGMPYVTKDQSWSFVTSKRINGSMRAGLDAYLGRRSRLAISEMAFYGASGRQMETNQHSPFGKYDTQSASRTSAFGKGTITCSDYTPQYDHETSFREISCFTPTGDFSCFFSGDEKDVSQFYQTLHSTTPTD